MEDRKSRMSSFPQNPLYKREEQKHYLEIPRFVDTQIITPEVIFPVPGAREPRPRGWNGHLRGTTTQGTDGRGGRGAKWVEPHCSGCTWEERNIDELTELTVFDAVQLDL